MRFYGGTPMGWLRDTPMAVVKACAAMLGQLQAQEALAAINVTAVGTQRKLTGLSIKSIADGLRRGAQGGVRQRGVPLSPWGLAAMGVGIGVTIVPPSSGVSNG